MTRPAIARTIFGQWGPATDPDVVRQYYYSKNADGGTNRSRYKNPEMDKMIDEAAAFTDPAKRQQAYAANKMKLSDVSLDWSSSYPLFYDASTTSS